VTVTRWDTATIGRHLDFEPSWRSLTENLFLLGNWHLLWYAAIALTAIAARHLLDRPLAPLAMIAAAALAFVFIAFSYPGVHAWGGDAAALSRFALPLAVVLVFLGALSWNELTRAAPATTIVSTDMTRPVADA
jgi:hypothetical protein